MKITAKTKSGLDAVIMYFHNEFWCGHVLSEYVTHGFCCFVWYPDGIVVQAHRDFDIDLKTIQYRGYNIRYDRKPIPTSEHDWDFAHGDYDGAPDSGDVRCGTASSLESATQMIDNIEGGFSED